MSTQLLPLELLKVVFDTYVEDLRRDLVKVYPVFLEAIARAGPEEEPGLLELMKNLCPQILEQPLHPKPAPQEFNNILKNLEATLVSLIAMVTTTPDLGEGYAAFLWNFMLTAVRLKRAKTMH